MPTAVHAPSLDMTPVQRMLRREREAEFPAAPRFTLSHTRFVDDRAHFSLDRQGVIRTHEASVNDWVYLPTNIARYVVGLYAAWRQGDDSVLPRLRANAHWLEANAKPRRAGNHRFLVYPLPIAEPPFHISVGAVSALTAANAVTALYSAGLALGDKHLMAMAHDLIPGFAVSIQQGGYRLLLGRHSVWYEEYSQPSTPPPRVLNGHIWALLNLHWYANVTGDQQVTRLFDLGTNGLRQSVASYTDTPISAYDLEVRSHICGYHYADIQLLQYMYELTGIARFRHYADLWARQTC